MDKVRENRLRRAAQRQKLALRKSRRRDPRAFDFGGYWLVDQRGSVVIGGDNGVDLDAVERYLAGDREG